MQNRPTSTVPTRLRHPSVRVLGALLGLLALVAAACGSGRGETATPAADDGGLPTLPPIEERQPELFDERGCLVIEPGRSDCSTRAEEIDAAAAGDATGAVRSLAGFLGRYYTETPTADAVVVLEETVATAPSGSWAAWGLVRNERGVALAGLVLHASLRGADGTELATASSPLAVSPLRPGEPAPFALRADVDVSNVVSVAWSVSQDLDGAREGSRDVELATYWERGFTDQRVVDMYLHTDVPPAHPYLLFGSATNLGADVIDEPKVVAAWLDGAGRVIWVADAVVAPTDGIPTGDAPAGDGATTTIDGSSTTTDGASAGTRLDAGTSGDFLVVVDEVQGLTLDGLEVMLWAVGA